MASLDISILMLLGNAGSFASKQKSLISDMRPNTDTSTVNSLTS